jgi:hypothetical protein
MLKTVSSITNAIGALNYKGTWNATTNTPTIVSATGTKGDYYVVSVAGATTIDGISNWGVGDWIVFNGAAWQRVEGGADLNGVNLSVSGTTTLSGLTASTALALDASKDVVSVANTGTGDNVLATSPTVTTPRVVTSLNDTNGNEILGITATASAVNELTVANAATGANPTISATGSDTNIGINLNPKGTGGIIFPAGAVGTPAITTTGDTNTGIFFPAADTIAFAEGGVEAARINANSSWLVGTTSAPTGAVNSIVPKAIGDGTGGIIGNNILINQFGTPSDAGTLTITLTGTNFQGYVDVFVWGTFGATNREGYAAYKVLWNRPTTSVTTITVQAATNTGGTFTTSYTFTASKPDNDTLTIAIGKPSGAGYGVFLNGQISGLLTISSSFA